LASRVRLARRVRVRIHMRSPAFALVIALAAGACGGSTRVCSGLVCANDLPSATADVSYFVVEGQPIDEPVTLANGTLQATAGIITSSGIPLDRCVMRVRWTGSRKGEATAPPPVIERVARSRTAIWRVSIPGFERADLVEVLRWIECPDGVTIEPGPSLDYVPGEDGLRAACRASEAPFGGAIEVETTVKVLWLEPAAAALVVRDGDRLVDACTNTTLLDLTVFGSADPDGVQPAVSLPHPKQRNEAVFANRFAIPGAAGPGPSVRIDLVRELPGDEVRKRLERHRFARVHGGVVIKPIDRSR